MAYIGREPTNTGEFFQSPWLASSISPRNEITLILERMSNNINFSGVIYKQNA